MRKMKKRLAAVLACALCALSSCAPAAVRPADPVTLEFPAMDTWISLKIFGTAADAEAARGALLDMESRWTVASPGSELSRVNSAVGKEERVSEDTARLIAQAAMWHGVTGGLFDATVCPLVRAWGFGTGELRVPDDEEIARLLGCLGSDRIRVEGDKVTVPEGVTLDAGGIAKGFAGDELCRMLRERGVESALLNLGGNVQLLGTKPDGSPWQIGVRAPDGSGRILGTVSASDACVITSGAYERYLTDETGKRYGHILDPRTGKPAQTDLLSVTVAAQQGTMGDALSTALFVMGREGAVRFWRENGGFDMLLVTAEGTLVVTEGIADRFVPSKEFEEGLCVEKRD